MYSILHMCTVSDDLATPARIRHAAIRLFGEQGFGVGLRAIAEEAGVEVGLIRHHYGSKEGLRAACDDQVLGEIRDAKERQFLDGNPAGQMLHNMATLEEYGPVLRYIFQELREGGDVARQFIERMTADAERYMAAAVEQGVMRPSRDPAGRVRFLTLAVLGGAMLDFALSETDDPQVGMRHWLDRMALPVLELYTEGLLTDSTMLDAYLAQAEEKS
jgi:AcrR family transcriptional regulator